MSGFMYRKVREEVRTIVYGMLDEGFLPDDIVEIYMSRIDKENEQAAAIVPVWIRGAAEDYNNGLPLVSNLVASVESLINKGVGNEKTV